MMRMLVVFVVPAVIIGIGGSMEGCQGEVVMWGGVVLWWVLALSGAGDQLDNWKIDS